MTRTRRPELLARRLELEPDETMTIAGLPVTTPERTWRDLAPRLGLPALVAAGDSVLRSGIAVDALVASVARGKRARGVRRAREAVELLDGRSASRPESHLRVAASLGGALRFAVNEAISRRDGGWLATPDLSLGEARLALEYQGDAHAELDRMRRDLTRFADLRREGWLVLAYGPAEVFGRPWEIEADVRRALHERAPHYLRARLAR
jgi:very-short-patch-repair endonuclease